MQCPRSMTTALGRWRGTSTLFKSWLPAPENVDSGPSTLTLALGPQSAWLEVHMDWLESGQPQHGILLVMEDDQGACTATWTDTWHSRESFMALAGHSTERGFGVTGSYGDEEHGTWGWRIEMALETPQSLRLRMINITPEGEEDLAVDALVAVLTSF